MPGPKPPSTSLIMRSLRPWWRLTRGLTLGAQGAVFDERGHVLLVRHRYRQGWFFPGGGVERHETLHSALVRELREETGVMLSGPAELHGLFANIENFPGDHIALFIVREWERPQIPPPNAEIAAHDFFPPDALPEGTDAGTRRRLAEIIGGDPVGESW
jgi:ADP-ribose pyrophosphatase YjhB (NUDIX family)